MMYGYEMMGWGWMATGFIIFLVSVAGLVFIWIKICGNKDSRDHSPEEMLKMRLAKGEISEEEYDRLMKKVQ